MTREAAPDRSLLEHISTNWSMIEDPTKFVLRYAPAIRQYIENLLKGAQDTDDVAHDFLVRVMTRGFSESQVTRGRFRDFLRVAVRHAVIDHWRAKRPTTADPQVLEATLAVPEDDAWVDSWRACLLDAAWLRLRHYERANPGNLYYTVLKLSSEEPDRDSTQLAAAVSSTTGRALRADAYRQQLHRARRKFAELLVEQVRETLRQDDPEELADELRELGLGRYVEVG